MVRAHPEAPATWYRLSEESWAEIREAYRNGATARELAARWKVSPGSVYRHACVGGWTKKRSADALARAHAQAIAEEEAADAAGLTRPAPEPLEATPAAMRERALRDMSRALAAGRYGEAQALVKLAEGLARLEAPGGAAPSAEVDDEEEQDAPPPEPGGLSEGALYIVKRLAEASAGAAWPNLRRIAEEMLEERAHPPAIFNRAVLRWRAEQFGPQVAEADRVAHGSSIHYKRFYDDEGRVREGWGLETDGRPVPEGMERFEADLAAAHAHVLTQEGAGTAALPEAPDRG